MVIIYIMNQNEITSVSAASFGEEGGGGTGAGGGGGGGGCSNTRGG